MPQFQSNNLIKCEEIIRIPISTSSKLEQIVICGILFLYIFLENVYQFRTITIVHHHQTLNQKYHILHSNCNKYEQSLKAN